MPRESPIALIRATNMPMKPMLNQLIEQNHPGRRENLPDLEPHSLPPNERCTTL